MKEIMADYKWKWGWTDYRKPMNEYKRIIHII